MHVSVLIIVLFASEAISWAIDNSEYDFIGDMAFPKGHAPKPVSPDKPRPSSVNRNFIRENEIPKWTGGKVSYFIADGFTTEEQQLIEQSANEITSITGNCVQFNRLDDVNGMSEPYVNVFKGEPNTCHAMVGMSSAGQALSLGDGCIAASVIKHEFLHSLGFFHEQNRPDRDDYIVINWDNISQGGEDQFEIYEGQTWTEYDYQSIMHYEPGIFTANGGNTMTKLDGSVEGIGGAQDLSESDIEEIKKAYKCDGTTDESTTTDSSTIGPTTDGTSTIGDATTGPTTDGEVTTTDNVFTTTTNNDYTTTNEDYTTTDGSSTIGDVTTGHTTDGEVTSTDNVFTTTTNNDYTTHNDDYTTSNDDYTTNNDDYTTNDEFTNTIDDYYEY